MRGGEEKPLIVAQGGSVFLNRSDPMQLVEEVEKDVDREASDGRACGADSSQREPVAVRVKIEVSRAA
jgi:hypothetical protein